MNTVNLIKTVRYYLSDDSALRTLFGSTSAANMRKFRLYYKDAIQSSSNEGGTQNFKYPFLTLKIDDDEPLIRWADDNVVLMELVIINKYGNANAALQNIQIKDRVKELFEEKHVELNAKAASLSPAVTLKIRDIAWVSAMTYDDKEQGSERRHKYICNLKLVVGD